MADEKKVREIDTPEWAEKVRQEALHRGSLPTTASQPINMNAPAGYELDIGTTVRVVTDARKDSKIAG